MLMMRDWGTRLANCECLDFEWGDDFQDALQQLEDVGNPSESTTPPGQHAGTHGMAGVRGTVTQQQHHHREHPSRAPS
jgi:hypothetical protein